MQHAVWVTALLSRRSESMLRDVFLKVLKFPHDAIKKDMHVTIYHARRHLPGLGNSRESISVVVPGSELRAMAMAPGDENPRADVDPRTCMIGLRIRRANGATTEIEVLRSRYYSFETKEVLGIRVPSNRLRSAFGARHFQPHVSVLRSGSVADTNLSILGEAIRSHVDHITLDRLVVSLRSR